MSTLENLRLNLDFFVKTSSGPLPADIYEIAQWEMAGAHGFLLNGLIHLYETAPSVPANKKRDFTEYALQWVAALDHHHQWEETIYYPLLNPKFDTDTIVAEHELFHEGVENLKEYLISCLPAGATWGYSQTVPPHDEQKFDASRLRSLVDAFAVDLAKHLMQEISYLDPSALRASGLTEAEMGHAASVTGSHMKSMPPFTFLTYVILHAPKGSGFPPVPGFLKAFLVPWVFYWPYRRLWQFAPKP